MYYVFALNTYFLPHFFFPLFKFTFAPVDWKKEVSNVFNLMENNFERANETRTYSLFHKKKKKGKSKKHRGSEI